VTNILIAVCSANVCRSPLAIATLEQAFAGSTLPRRITMQSRGVDVVPGAAVCDQALQLARAYGLGTRLIDGHRATALDVDALAAADLILTADRRVRSQVVKLDPRAATRTFTFRESAALARLVASAPDDGRPHDLAGFAAALHDNRGLIDLPGMERSAKLPWRRMTLHAHDVPDAHTDRQVSHRAVYRALAPAMLELAQYFTAYTSVRQP